MATRETVILLGMFTLMVVLGIWFTLAPLWRRRPLHPSAVDVR